MKLIDFVIPSRRPLSAMVKLFEDCAKTPHVWRPHHFIVVYDKEEQVLELQGWLLKAKKDGHLLLPTISVIRAREGSVGRLNALRQQGLEFGHHPYVYFQDDDDPLPENLEGFVAYMEDDSMCMALYGLCEMFNARGTIIEKIPATKGGRFFVSPLEACHYFPTYLHPLAALFRRSVFGLVPVDDGHSYQRLEHGAFLNNLLNSDATVDFSSELIRRSSLHMGNDNGIFSPQESKEIAQDILTWVGQMKDVRYAEFQREIAHRINAGEIRTYREIASLIEEEILSR